MGLYDNYTVKAEKIANSGLQLFHKAHRKLLKANDILVKANADIEDELQDLNATHAANTAALNENLQVIDNLKPFLGLVPEDKTNENEPDQG